MAVAGLAFQGLVPLGRPSEPLGWASMMLGLVSN